ncbi:hypothetical protein BME96_16420 [Virgibacillus halodenitrificans]|uniref:Uncharacterized protein n=1 Tax=Virgibacillus halodenitrificans TaxID=1482 RepID=A0AAC9NMG6_VIRHA|nr:hypothetical protein [Virgibacillus halodenitrificans]APC49676.1 hypothetical protein BME96_16420 [Virgibacillus halodenitrificans]
MLTIHPPTLIKTNDHVRIQATFETEAGNKELWFSVPNTYSAYLLEDRGDAFLVGLLLLAMKNGWDIKINCPISERLYYTLTNYLIKALHLAMPHLKEINLFPKELDSSQVEQANGVGTGFSGGVDSFFTIYEHHHSTCPESFRLTHFVYHNVGSHGDFGGDATRTLFQKRLELVKPFAEEVQLPLIEIDSNISEILQMDYVPTHTIRNAAAILVLQGLFRYYYYSSGRQFKDFELSPTIGASYDILSLNMLSTESLDFFSAGSAFSRFEKTEAITNYEPTYRHLNVCTSNAANCSVCPKCLRTQLTLEATGKLEFYKEVFDLSKYKNARTAYLAEVLATMHHDDYAAEIIKELRVRGIEIPTAAYFRAPLLRSMHSLKQSGRKMLKKKNMRKEGS